MSKYTKNREGTMSDLQRFICEARERDTQIIGNPDNHADWQVAEAKERQTAMNEALARDSDH